MLSAFAMTSMLIEFYVVYRSSLIFFFSSKLYAFDQLVAVMVSLSLVLHEEREND